MMNVQLAVQHLIRRVLDLPNKWIPRTHIPISRRLLVLLCSLSSLLFLCYLIFLRPTPKHSREVLRQCAVGEFERHSISYTIEHVGGNQDGQHSVNFIGNGFIALDASLDSQLLLWPQNESHASPLLTAFYPLVSVAPPSRQDWSGFYQHPDHAEGMAKSMSCSIVSNKCVCIYQLVYAHRTRQVKCSCWAVLSPAALNLAESIASGYIFRPNALVQELRISNPTASTIELGPLRRVDTSWETHKKGSLPIHVNTFPGDRKIIVGVVCSSTPSQSLSVKPRTEETLRFLCLVDQDTVNPPEGEMVTKERLVARLAKDFASVNDLNSNTLDDEHKTAWKTLNLASFKISHSKAPGALNLDLIESTRHALLSSVRAPMIEVGESDSKRKLKKELLAKNELCYSGHSTLLTPSKLWHQSWGNVRELLKTLEVWLLTLEHRGCAFLIRAGAQGVAQAFVLSLVGGTFTHRRLEITLDPETELHRNIIVENLRFGTGTTALHVEFDMDTSLRPFVKVSATSLGGGNLTKAPPQPLFACSAGCTEPPRAVGKIAVELPIKVTKPPTPILFVAEKREQLERIKETLHVANVFDAPPHESRTIDLHKHGQSSGLPTLFWVVLVILLLAFHLFLFKLLYTEWKNASSIPYTKFGKKTLLKQ